MTKEESLMLRWWHRFVTCPGCAAQHREPAPPPVAGNIPGGEPPSPIAGQACVDRCVTNKEPTMSLRFDDQDNGDTKRMVIVGHCYVRGVYYEVCVTALDKKSDHDDCSFDARETTGVVHAFYSAWSALKNPGLPPR